LDPAKFSAAEKRNKDRQAQIEAEKQRLKGVGSTPSTPPKPPQSTAPSSTSPAPSPKPKAAKPTPTQPKTSSATASTAEKIKGGSEVYKRQIKMGDIKGAEATGKATWALANPKLAAAAAERERTRGTSATTNPQMADLKSRLPAPKTSSSEVSTPSPSKVKTDTAVQRIQPASQSAAKSIEAEVKKRNIPTFNTSKMTTTLRQSYEYDAYDLVLEYLFDTGHVDTIEEANYVMMQMDSNYIQNIVETIGGDNYRPNPIGNAIKTGAGIIKKTLNNPSVSNTIRTGSQIIKRNIPSGGYSTKPGDGKPYKDGPLWDGPETSVKKPIPQPQRKPQAPMRDEPLW
jgi:hypothetical protein